MKRFLFSGIGLVALSLAARPSVAADLPRAPVVKAPAAVAAPIFNWSGPYAGLHCGAAWGRARTSTADGFDNAGPTVESVDGSGWLCGAQAGYNWQAGSWLYGVEGDVGYLGVEERALNRGDGDDLVAFKYNDWYGTLTGRIGPTWDRSALYLKAGAAVARIRNFGGDANGADTGDFTSITKTKWGWTIGAGYEQALSPAWSWKLEYLYMDFGKAQSGNLDGNTFEHRNRVQTVKLGINYRFATGGKAPVAAPAVVTKY
ncbi:MAG TPA: outer membrane protein [Xanthobacteraceae bacterium]|nr:outer membrane protein [Xanthobacteraceae bacterium]